MKNITLLFLAGFFAIAFTVSFVQLGSLVHAQEVNLAGDVKLEIQGSCVNYTATVVNLSAGCYDIKVDATSVNGRIGEIFDPREGWKSSFFFVNNICIEGGNVKFLLRTSEDETLNFRATVKSNATSSEMQSSYVAVEQHCPVKQPEPIEYFLIVVLLSIVIVFAGIVLYVKKWRD